MATKAKRPLTEAQRNARVANLAAGRAKRLERIKEKKANPVDEFDINSDSDSGSSSDSSSSSDGDFVISKKKKTPKFVPPTPTKKSKSKNEVAELRNMFMNYITQQSAAGKKKSKPRRKSGGTTIIVPQTSSQVSPQIVEQPSAYLEALRKSIK